MFEKLYFPCDSDLFPSSAYNNYVTGWISLCMDFQETQSQRGSQLLQLCHPLLPVPVSFRSCALSGHAFLLQFLFSLILSLLPLSSSSSLQFSLPAASNLWWQRRVYINNTQTTKILIFLGSHLCVDSKCAEYILWYQSPCHCSHLSVASPAGFPDTNIYWGISQARWIMACGDHGDKTKDPRTWCSGITRAASTSVGDRKEVGTQGGMFKCGMEQGGRGAPLPVMTWQLSLGLAVHLLAGPELPFLCPHQLTHGAWLPCMSTALFLLNHKSLTPSQPSSKLTGAWAPQEGM